MVGLHALKQLPNALNLNGFILLQKTVTALVTVIWFYHFANKR